MISKFIGRDVSDIDNVFENSSFCLWFFDFSRPGVPEEKDRAKCFGPSAEPGGNHDQPAGGAAEPQVSISLYLSHRHTHTQRSAINTKVNTRRSS